VVQGTAVIALLSGVIVGTDKALGIILVAAGLLFVIFHQYRRHRPPAPHG
jgi:hypothetical protein